ncbi:MAG: hypothetical protein NZ896_03330 [Nitrososphaerales archaeon]|nr:hypothetical protein [Nitrososphaerales archaeon]
MLYGFDKSSTNKKFDEENKLNDLFPQDLCILPIVIEVLTNIFGPNGAAFITYQIGKKLAEVVIEHSMKLEIELPLYINEYFQRSGVGVVKINSMKCIAVIKDTNPSVDGGGCVSCYLIRGFFQRYLQIVFGEDVEVEERRCRSHGDKFCEFYVKIKEDKE